MLLLTLTIFLIQFTNACLKIRSIATTTTPTPICDCPYQLLNSSNIQLIRDHSFFQANISKARTSNPIEIVEDCVTTMYCSDEKSLVLLDLDDDSVQMFGEYQADAYCDKYSKVWTVFGGEELNKDYEMIYATCVDFGPFCPCTSALLTASNAKSYLTDFGLADAYFKLYETSLVEAVYTETPCPSKFRCPMGQTPKSIIQQHQVYTYRLLTPTGFNNVFVCSADGNWKQGGLGVGGPELFTFCAGLEPKCKCPSPLVWEDTRSVLAPWSSFTQKNPNMKFKYPEFTANDYCVSLPKCSGEQKLVVFYASGEAYEQDSSPMLMCNGNNQYVDGDAVVSYIACGYQ